MKLRALGMKGYPPIMAEWGPLDFVNYSPDELRRLYSLLEKRLQELKNYLDSISKERAR